MADATAPARPAGAPLDDVMLAMDVVDTLRHRDQWVERELDEAKREEDLLERLRRIYRGQGIEVPDRVLQEGVQALKESRFVYTPPPPGFATTLARLWVGRDRIGKALAALAALLILAWGAHYALVARPRAAAEQAMTEAHAGALAASGAPSVRERADRLLSEGREALASGDEARATGALTALQTLQAELPREYVLRIVGEVAKQVPTALHRRNHYLIVEAVAPDGGRLSVPVTSEEDGSTRITARWGIRVPEDTYIAVERDRRDDGVLQRDRLGEKRRGEPDVAYAMPVQGGTITQWQGGP
jgi:hypothetical protein